MRTLKTITAILPMTLLLACGGGGGGYSSAPAPSIQPNPVLSEAEINDTKVKDDVEIIEEAADGNEVFTIEAQSITVDNFKHDSFGDWDTKKGYAHGIDPETGKLTLLVADYENGLVWATEENINPTFNGAVYTGDTVTRRTSGKIEPGNVHITLKVNQSGDLKKMKFKFVGSDYEWNKNLKFGKNALFHENGEFTTNKYKNRKNENGDSQLKGVRGRFFGDNADLIMGWFGHKKIGVLRGTFGAERDDVEFK